MVRLLAGLLAPLRSDVAQLLEWQRVQGKGDRAALPGASHQTRKQLNLTVRFYYSIATYLLVNILDGHQGEALSNVQFPKPQLPPALSLRLRLEQGLTLRLKVQKPWA